MRHLLRQTECRTVGCGRWAAVDGTRAALKLPGRHVCGTWSVYWKFCDDLLSCNERDALDKTSPAYQVRVQDKLNCNERQAEHIASEHDKASRLIRDAPGMVEAKSRPFLDITSPAWPCR